MTQNGTCGARVLLHAFSTFSLGGAQARFVQLANALGPGYRHVVMAMDNCFDAGAGLAPGVLWEPVSVPVIKGGALANRRLFRTILRRMQPDLLLSYNWGAIEWAAANCPRVCPQVHVEDGFGPDEAQGQLPRRVWMRRVLLALNGLQVVVASRNLERLARSTWKIPAHRVVFVRNGVDVPNGLRCPPATANPLAVLRIGTVAGLRPEKNIARLIRAFAQIQKRYPSHLSIVGDGPLHAELQKLVCDLGMEDKVEFTGYLADPLAHLVTLDLFALSSDTEQLPLALLEAMAVGMPVVATRVGDVGAVLASVSPDNLCAPDDAAFAAQLLQVLDCQTLWPQWAQAGQDKVRAAYSKKHMTAQWKQVFDGHAADLGTL
ncbi:glycosyltransferase [Simplicispira psychrophila]|uniref:glycosyltransferase n=1 Tax=Simplicispira psychrophila TaxID=80882 RepID=UPI000A05AA1F|nr:glycosyltransferase [Simplicispira psychrophila]